MSDASWSTSDAWVFAAISNDQSGRPHTLRELIALADGLNHDVITEREFTTAIGRLLTAGLIEADAAGDRYWPTEAAANIRKRWKHGLFGWIATIPPQLERLGKPQDADWSLPPGVFDQAVREYLARWP